MKLGDGVEQAIHSVSVLAGLPEGGLLSAAALAEFHGVSTSYLLKHLQSLSRAGIVKTVPGPKGGYLLAKPASKISLLDVVLAVEGPEPAFRCKEIRRNGPSPLLDKHYRSPCQINAAMLRAELAYRNELRSVTIEQINAQVLASDDDGAIVARGCKLMDMHLRHLS
ncbi:Rrf2 family transcriptional regulator [Lentilitoribacter sp. Alg239-R112]|uniref:Rrf2 family transcriptional regulator n=1 Tax=Lentilitoribacter sp. Alg239-R112 TaxID=2305987 RepID=UPI0013A6F2F7|nr:Rrf2 family transcriptional regulator [Lentilitoribacter sp. Alg239-R112]